MVILRDMIASDIEDYVSWFAYPSEENDWDRYDAPWEKEETTPEAERQAWTANYRAVRDMPPGKTRWRFEIEADGQHIGWVSAYDDLGYVPNPQELPAIGIDIPLRVHRGHGYGQEALRLFMEHWQKQGYKQLYTQTWSGNTPMIRLAEKLGFREHARAKGLRVVDGLRYDAVTFIIDL